MKANLIFFNGKILTMNESFGIVEALAIRKERIIALGTKEEIFRLKGKTTLIIDLRGDSLLPGLIDSHNHMSRMGRVLGDVLLYQTKSISEIISLLKKKIVRLPYDFPLVGRGNCWDEISLKEGRLPTRFDLDQVASNRPVMITDVNKTIINTFVLKKIGVTRETANPEGGFIGKERATGEPNGIFFFAAKHLTPLGSQSAGSHTVNLEEAIKRADNAFVKLGLTGVVDPMVDLEVIEAYRRLNRAGKINLRVTLMPKIDLLNKLKKKGLYYGFTEGKLRIGPLKLFFDPFIMHKTSYLYQSYEGEPTNYGMVTMSPKELEQKIATAIDANWPVGIHTTGDRGLDLAVAAYKNVFRKRNFSPGLNSVIHAYLPTREALTSLKKMGIAVALQPSFIHTWGETLRKYLGEKRAAYFTPLRSYLDTGIIVGGGSDAPITFFNPFLGVYAAVSRKTAAGRVLGPKETISLKEALRIYTIGSAYLADGGYQRGSLEVGKLSDLVVVEGDLLNVPTEELEKIKVKMTVIGGDIIYKDEE